MRDLSSVPWASMPVYGSPRAQSSLIKDDVLVTGIPPEDPDEDVVPDGADDDAVPDDQDTGEPPEEANTGEGP
jgi:hypothetical protein